LMVVGGGKRERSWKGSSRDCRATSRDSSSRYLS
jgi:hypothetical protein